MHALLASHGWQMARVDVGDEYWQSPLETWQKPGHRFAVKILCRRHGPGYFAQTNHRGRSYSTGITETVCAALVSGEDELDEIYDELTEVAR